MNPDKLAKKLVRFITRLGLIPKREEHFKLLTNTIILFNAHMMDYIIDSDYPNAKTDLLADLSQSTIKLMKLHSEHAKQTSQDEASEPT